MHGAGAQFFFTGPGFTPDENGTNLDAPHGGTASSNVAAGVVVKDCAECPVMVYIPAGSFRMGADVRGDAWPPHTVRLSNFLMGQTEVTQKQWVSLMGINPSRFNNCGADCPVENVSWDDVQTFIFKLNQKTGKGYRLPSEAEWEYAARAGTTSEWSFGNFESSVGNYAWYEGNSGGSTHTVKQKMPNAFGLFDIHGNVWEWTQDCYRAYYDGAPVDGSPRTANCDGRRVMRGGSWGLFPSMLRSAYRSWSYTLRSEYVGFRLARDL